MNLNLSLIGGNYMQSLLTARLKQASDSTKKEHYFSLYKLAVKLMEYYRPGYTSDDLQESLDSAGLEGLVVFSLTQLDRTRRLIEPLDHAAKKELARGLRVGDHYFGVELGDTIISYTDAVKVLAYEGFIDRREAKGLRIHHIFKPV